MLAGLVAAAGCGPASQDAGVSADVGRGWRVELVVDGTDAGAAAAGPGTEPVVARLEPPADLDGWEVVADSAEVVAPADGSGGSGGPDGSGGAVPERVLRVRGAEKRVLVTGDFEPDAFNVLQLVLASPVDGTVSVLVRRAGRPFCESERVGFAGAPGPRVVEVGLPGLAAATERFDQLLVELEGHAGAVELYELLLVRRPLAAFLPKPGTPGPVRLARQRPEVRSAVGLATDRGLRARFPVEPGAELAFSCGWPEALRAPDRRLEVLLRIDALDGDEPFPAVEHRLELAVRGARPPSWHEAVVDLGPLAGRTVELALSLETSDGRAAACAIAEPRLRVRGRTAPTVLLVTSDTHRADHVGASGLGVAVDTPAIDALAARGVLFEDCYSAANVTQPSHTALLTGLALRDHGVLDNVSRLEEGAHTLAEAFRSAGFHTFAVVSVKHLDAGSGLSQGFDRLHAPRTTWTAGEALALLEACLDRSAGEPVFCWLHLFDAHAPYAPPPPFDRCYYPDGRDPRDPALPELDVPAHCIPEAFHGIRDLGFPAAQYRAEVRYLDSELARLLERPRVAAGIVAVTADHGEVLERDGSYFNHASLCPATLHVPLVLAWPDAPGGERIARPVDHLDLGRTLLDLAGLDTVGFPGRSLLAQPPDPLPRFAIASHGRSASVTHAGWHLVLHLDHHKSRFRVPRERHQVELFDLEGDPECLVDLSASEDRRTARMRELLVEWLAAADREGAVALSGGRSITSEEARQLEALGYTAGASAEGAGSSEWLDADCECARCAPFR